MMENRDVLVGIDGGGTRSRALCVAMDGTVLAETSGAGTNPDYNSAALANFRSLVDDVLQMAGRTCSDIAALGAGLAGLDEPNDHEWALEMTGLPGLRRNAVYVNDSVVAQMGAFAMKPGIVVVLSTGAITVGITESDDVVCNYDFNHYARASARFLSHDAIFRLLTEPLKEADQPFLSNVLAFWQVDNLHGLRDVAKGYKHSDRESSVKRYGQMAPLLTSAAAAGSPVAMRTCDHGADGTALGVRIVASCFESDTVPVALNGGLALSDYMQQAVRAYLGRPSFKQFAVVEPLLSPTAGAVLLAARELGADCVEAVRTGLLTGSI